jgi:hypothetical protein
MDSGLPPRTPRLWARRPCFSTTLRLTRTRQVFPMHPVSSGDRHVQPAWIIHRDVSGLKSGRPGASAIGWIGRPGRVPEMSPNGYQQPTIAASHTR